MMRIKLAGVLVFLQLFVLSVYCQPAATEHTAIFSLIVVNEKMQAVDGATVKMLKDNRLVKTSVTDIKGLAGFDKIAKGNYTFLISYTGYKPQTTRIYSLPSAAKPDTIKLLPLNTVLQEVTVTSQAPLITQQRGKVVIDVAASVTNAGSTVLEVLEKSPGVTVDRNGGIFLQGKSGVLVMIDDKPTYLGGDDLTNLLSSMNSNQVSQIELIAVPGAKYEARGNAGIINIKTKKNKQKGFNGTFSTSLGQGVYPKNNNSLLLNYRVGRVNTFLNYTNTYNEYYIDLYALRKYYTNNQVTTMLEQPSYLAGKAFNNTIKTGLDYNITDNTTVGFVLTGTAVHRKGRNTATATWQDPAGAVDSAIYTASGSNNHFKNGAVNLNARHSFSPMQDIAVDFDLLHYNIKSETNFNNQLLAPGGYLEQSRGFIPTGINILSGKADYTLKLNKDEVLLLGWKSSSSKTDNTATYQNLNGATWVDDNSRSNHFIYHESINAAYASLDKKYNKLTLQAGLRYEHTGYDAHQLGNAIQKDSAFSRNYGELFPSGYASYQADTSNSFTLTAGRRIDRPAFQSLNPFYFIINKYTYNTGNPFLLPQFSWNFELSHQYKNLLTSSISYSNIKNYFSQIFLADANEQILLYTQGNVGHTYNIGVTTALSVEPYSWWSLTAQAVYNHKQLRGFNGNNYTSNIDQINFSSTQQFTIAKLYTAELSGFYTTRARNDVQELLYPTGQLSFGIARPILKKKATIKFSARDIFYTNAMEGLTQFPNATEYFKLRRDSRVYTIAFTYRFGKSYKATKRSGGSAGDEMDRVGNG